MNRYKNSYYRNRSNASRLVRIEKKLDRLEAADKARRFLEMIRTRSETDRVNRQLTQRPKRFTL